MSLMIQTKILHIEDIFIGQITKFFLVFSPFHAISPMNCPYFCIIITPGHIWNDLGDQGEGEREEIARRIVG